MQKHLLAVILCAALLSACSGASVEPTTTLSPSPTLFLTPVPTNTPILTATPTPMPTSTPTPVCEFSNDFLKQLKTKIPYDQFTLHYLIFPQDKFLTIWYVDPEIDVLASEDTFGEEMNGVLTRATEIAILLRNADPCVDELVSIINPVVVDTNFLGWFSGWINPRVIPTGPTITPEDIGSAMSYFEIDYQLDTPPPDFPPIPEGACEWAEVNQALYTHFNQGRENVGFYLVINPGGVNLWAQWDGSSDSEIVAANLLNIDTELGCLFPAPNNLLYIVVDEQDGHVRLFAGLFRDQEGVDMNTPQVLYKE